MGVVFLCSYVATSAAITIHSLLLPLHLLLQTMSSSYVVKFGVQVRMVRNHANPLPQDQERYLPAVNDRKPDFVAYCSADFCTEKAFEMYEATDYSFAGLSDHLNRFVFGMEYWSILEPEDSNKVPRAVVSKDGAFQPVHDGYIEVWSLNTEPVEGAHTKLDILLESLGYGKYLD